MANNYLGWGLPYVDTTKGADAQLNVLDEPQVFVPGIHGATVPVSLRSNRVDNYTALIVEACNALSFPRGLSAKLADVTVWLGAWCTTFNALKWLLPLSGLWWLPWAVYGLIGTSFACIVVAACWHRPVFIPFAVLRCVIIAIAWTL
jgi:hypothetical protein